MSVAQQGVGLWGGVQLGADLGRNASLLFGASTSSRPVAVGDQAAGRVLVSLGLGFNAAVFSREPGPRVPTTAPQAFIVSPSTRGRIRVAIRVRAGDVDSVEFASDCTRWMPVLMQRSADVWIVDVPATAGLHHANIRING